jgi:tRNA(His) guanylyltransferase
MKKYHKRIGKEPLRVFEDAYDFCAIPGVYLVARLDGRNFSKVTKELNCKKPFDDKFNEIMSQVTMNLMSDSGFNVVYGYTQSDEISLLLHKEFDSFNRRISKLNSVLASLASSVFTNLTGKIVCFDCRISHLPRLNDVVQYFLWRQNDAHRNALNGYCYWTLKEKHSTGEVVRMLLGKSESQMQEILFQEGINYNDITTWHKRGTGFYYDLQRREGYNPIKKEKVVAIRKVLTKGPELSFGRAYGMFISQVALLT